MGQFKQNCPCPKREKQRRVCQDALGELVPTSLPAKRRIDVGGGQNRKGATGVHFTDVGIVRSCFGLSDAANVSDARLIAASAGTEPLSVVRSQRLVTDAIVESRESSISTRLRNALAGIRQLRKCGVVRQLIWQWEETF